MPSSGKLGNIEVIVYGKDSIYAKNQILKNSPDALARSIASQELLELLGVLADPTLSANATIQSGSATEVAPAEVS